MKRLCPEGLARFSLSFQHVLGYRLAELPAADQRRGLVGELPPPVVDVHDETTEMFEGVEPERGMIEGISFLHHAFETSDALRFGIGNEVRLERIEITEKILVWARCRTTQIKRVRRRRSKHAN